MMIFAVILAHKPFQLKMRRNKTIGQLIFAKLFDKT